MTTEGLRSVLITASTAPESGESEGLGTPFHSFSRSSSISILVLAAKAIKIVLRHLNIGYFRARASAEKAHRRRGNLLTRVPARYFSTCRFRRHVYRSAGANE
jgi:hypothetical protein